MTEQTPKKPSKWSKPDQEEAARDEIRKQYDEKVDPVEEMKQQAEQAAPSQDLLREFTAQDIIKVYKLGLWVGKRLGQLYVLQRDLPYMRKQLDRLQKAGHKIGVLKAALRANVEANALTAEAFDD